MAEKISQKIWRASTITKNRAVFDF